MNQSPISEPSPGDLLERTLTRAVVLATGDPAAQPRLGQLDLATSILETMSEGTRVAAEAPTGSGKTFAAGVPAMLLAALRDERTVISTESLALQSQLITKDLPVVSQAIEDTTGVRPSFAVLKGWSNYACVASAVGVAAARLGVSSDNCTPYNLEALLADLDSDTPEAVRWAIQSVVDGTSGDRATFTGQCTDGEWQSVSVSTAECIGVKDCPFGEVCRPAAARAAAGQADVLVTNHAMLGVQAVTSAPVVIGNKKLGLIDHLVIDEAHGLPNVVRNQGATNIGAVAVHNILRAVERAADIHGRTNSLRMECFDVCTTLDRHLELMLGKQKVVAVPDLEDSDGWADVADQVRFWLGRARAEVPSKRTRVMADIRARRAILGRIDGLTATMTAVAKNPKEYARWVEIEYVPSRLPKAIEAISGAVLHISPVDVGPMLRGTIYAGGPTYAAAKSDTDSGHDGRQDTDDTPDAAIPPSVTLLSATLPQSVIITAGLSVRRTVYPSPFDRAYDQSLLFVPKLESGDVDQIAPKSNSRRRFDTMAHPAWAVGYMIDLLKANGGSALVLSATTNAGRFYAERVGSECPNITIHSQWDGEPVRQVVDRWRADTGSVLIGTRSLMTGVDAPGGTCSMVIIDRVPRSAGNPVDDARAANIMERLEVDRWQAARMVYVADAALLMEQASGRLIRSIDDSGVVAILDPRLLRTSLVAYQESTRKRLLAALDRFPHRTSSLETVHAKLAERAGLASVA